MKDKKAAKLWLWAPFPGLPSPRRALERHTTAIAAHMDLTLYLTLMVTLEEKHYLPSCVQVQNLRQAGEYLVQNSPSTWTCGPGFEASIPGTRWLALNDPQHECTPMPFQRTANTEILSKFLQQGTGYWTKTHLEIIQFKSRGAEDCLQPPGNCVFFHLFIRVLEKQFFWAYYHPSSMIKHNHPEKSPYPVPLNAALGVLDPTYRFHSFFSD